MLPPVEKSSGGENISSEEVSVVATHAHDMQPSPLYVICIFATYMSLDTLHSVEGTNISNTHRERETERKRDMEERGTRSRKVRRVYMCMRMCLCALCAFCV